MGKWADYRLVPGGAAVPRQVRLPPSGLLHPSDGSPPLEDAYDPTLSHAEAGNTLGTPRRQRSPPPSGGSEVGGALTGRDHVRGPAARAARGATR
jgi:hypothetical protein